MTRSISPVRCLVSLPKNASRKPPRKFFFKIRSDGVAWQIKTSTMLSTDLIELLEIMTRMFDFLEKDGKKKTDLLKFLATEE